MDLNYRAIDKLLPEALDKSIASTDRDARICRRIRKFSLTISYVLLLDAIVWQRSEVFFLKRGTRT